ncbi:MAG: Slp family lipoprotein [Gammaproteobacteria bacterium]
MKRYLITLCFLLNACSNLPPTIKNPPLFDISYTQAIEDVAHYKNAPVRWGGVIVGVENEQDFSLIQVLYYPLNDEGRPQTDQPNEGRFLIKSPEFLDPVVYTKNTEITVAGTIVGELERTIGKKVLRLPLVAATTIYRWQVYVYDNYYDGFGYGYNPYYGGYPYYWGSYYWPTYTPFIRPPFRRR